ncbi:TIGR02281 family clan AA aspartic protease [Thauera sp.]|uniref:retropepsin-like aspartic protease family protein n=1 Tax=Thauera sp. TaxID=1905334 RepID=UPI002611121A|nr:TIGR02281 family clan AA aspartic protease [Thauera sp.]
MLAGGLCCIPPAQAVEIALAGVFGSKVVLVVDGGMPQTLGIDQRTREGIRLRALSGRSATLEHEGRLFELRLGEHAASAQSAGTSEVSLQADGGGHFFADAAVNGRGVRVLVDTGATLVAMGRTEAVRLGIDYRSGQPGQSETANGVARVWRVKLDSVELRGIRLYGVEAAVHESELPYVLLGMSFMNRMDWRREGERLLLKRRY